MSERSKMAIFPNGVKLIKWGRKEEPTAEWVAEEMKRFGYNVYDLQTVAPWFERSRHAHDEPEIRGAVSGAITFHFDDFPVTIEGGDILLIPGGLAHEVISHNSRPFSAYKGSLSGERKVTEHGDARGSMEDLARKAARGK
ncbi:MAG TPA: AraC family ligand binding domain-containing protein [Candidatus Manganitrophaceae bacterium]|nr:AraC family ligand binding domain-containing protein [Candidatus Manganitrophaceae bacterium]